MLSIHVKRLISTVTALVLLISAFSLIPFDGYATDDSIYTSEDGLWQYKFRDGSRIGVCLTSGLKYVSAYLGGDSEIEVPSIIDGYRVSEIGEYAFYNLDDAAQINLPYTINEIDSSAFAFCDSLRSIALPTGILDIGDYCFLGCSLLQSVSISDGLENIGYRAFYNCPLLDEVDMPQGIRNISRQAFSKTALIESAEGEVCLNGNLLLADSAARGEYTVSPAVVTVAGGAFEDCDGVSMITIPDSVRFVSDGAFEGCDSLTSVSLPDTVESIGEFACSHCPRLESIYIGSGAQLIGDGLAYNCPKLKRITISNDNLNYSSFDGVLYDKSLTELIRFPSANEIAVFSVPETVRSIDPSAFKDAVHLRRVEINRGISEITPNCFENCRQLEGVKLPETVVRIDAEAFLKCISLNEINFPVRLKSIDRSAFMLCRSLKEINLSIGIETVAAQAFEGCSALEKLDLSKCRAQFSGSAFRHCDSLESAVLPDSLVSIPDYMFADCTSLNSITFGKSTQTVGAWAFKNCRSIGKIYIPENIHIIGAHAFSGCEGLSVIKLSQGVERIGAYAFENCASLGYANLPDSLVAIGDYAFAGCMSLRGLNIGKNISTAGRNILSGCTPQSITGYNDTFAEVLARTDSISFESLGYPYWDDPAIPDDIWYSEPMKYCINKGYLKGVSKGDYRPVDNITREDFLTVLARAAGVNPTEYQSLDNGFEDVSDSSYYTYAVNWAKENGIVNGYSDTEFGVGIYVTREQMAVMLYRYFGSPTVSNVDNALSAFEDTEELDAESTTAFAWMLENGFISGMSDNELGAKAPAGRAQIAAVVMRLDQQGMFSQNEF